MSRNARQHVQYEIHQGRRQNTLNTVVSVSGFQFHRIADSGSIANTCLPREVTKQSLLVNPFPFLEGESTELFCYESLP